MASNPPPPFKERIAFLVDSTLRSYSVVFFSQKNLFGFLILLATFVEPVKGAFGLLGLFCANGVASVVGYERSAIRKGYYGFNAMLVGLALSYFYAPTMNLLVVTVLSSFLVTFLTAGLQHVLWYYLRLPAMSLPFVLVFSVAITASLGFGKLEIAAPAVTADFLRLPLVELFLKSLGSVFFQVNIISGGIILFALLV
ncbi:MAG: urea transporter, partial [Bacteroidota bacterium]